MAARTQIKICGINSTGSLEAAIAARASHAGFNFFPPSPRFAGPDLAAQLSQQAASRIVRVGVFVDADDAFLAQTLAASPLDALQFHGAESPERVAQAKAHFGLPVWKVLSVSAREDLPRAQNYAGAADFLLLDAKTPKGAALPGGNGLAFDWRLVAQRRWLRPWMLAGGLTPGNVAEAVRLTNARQVDVSSGVESAPGVKDADLIAAFCQAARAA